jgi:hypothetical protein
MSEQTEAVRRIYCGCPGWTQSETRPGGCGSCPHGTDLHIEGKCLHTVRADTLCHGRHVSIAWNMADGPCPLCAALDRVDELKKDRDRWIAEYEGLMSRAQAEMKP